jgi:hypothetical protein
VERSDIEIGKTQDLALVAHLVVLHEVAIHEHEAALKVFAVEANARQMIEEHVKMVAGPDLRKPRRAFAFQALEAGAG